MCDFAVSCTPVNPNMLLEILSLVTIISGDPYFLYYCHFIYLIDCSVLLLIYLFPKTAKAHPPTTKKKS